MSTPSNRASGPGQVNNRLLERLPEEEFAALAPLLMPRAVKLKQVLVRPGEPIQEVFFPTTAVISALVDMEDSSAVETGITGAEGMVGLYTALGLESDPQRSICQVPGKGYSLSARSFRQALERSRPLQSLMLRYAAVVLRQTGQGMACNTLHPAPERLSRWLLMSHDRVGRDEFTMTQEFMGDLLGVRRPTVSIAAGTLKAAGLIAVRRGYIRIVDRPGLEQAACECYAIIRRLYEQIFPEPGEAR
jgi:CRP-like cAMP-binding protein